MLKPVVPFHEADALARLAAGEEQAFTAIYNQYWEKLFAIAYNYTKQKQAAEEVVQELFLQLWQRRAELVIHDLGAYLATACKFAVIKQLVKNKRHKELEKLHLQPELTVDEEAKINARFLADLMHGIVEQLPPQCKIIYKLRREQQLTIPEIAEELHIAPKTAENQLSKAQKQLRNALKNLQGWFFYFV